jgi:thiol-disulfide isomerase/thioredoxin
MTDAEPTPPSPAPRRRLTALAALAVVLVAAAGVLYGIYAQGGKETAPAECGPAAATVQRLAPLVKGEIAALALAKTPRLATPIHFTGPDGGEKTLADFRGRTVLVNLWATWCVPCREEMPALDRLQARLGSPSFEVVAVNIDTARLERRKSFLNEAGVQHLASYADPSADVFQVLKKAGKVLGLPTTMLIDPAGCELGLMPGPADWSSADALNLLGAASGG